MTLKLTCAATLILCMVCTPQSTPRCKGTCLQPLKQLKIVLLNILYMHVAPMTSLAELISKMFLYALL